MSFVIKNIECFDPIKIAESGQAFRIHQIDDTHVETVALGKYLQIAILGDNNYAFSCTEDEFNSLWSKYFDLTRDYKSIIAGIDPDDEYLKAAAIYGYGIRILKQDIFETIISFIISQRRSIPSITTCVDRFCEKFGKKITPKLSDPFVSPIKNEYYSFPTPKELNNWSIKDFNDIGAGYRSEYIASAIHDFQEEKLTYSLLENADDDKAYELLTKMHGVGPKVANCIMLFGLARFTRFPIDVWMQRIIDRHYNGSYDYSIYKEAGIMQQFMFYYERTEKTH